MTKIENKKTNLLPFILVGVGLMVFIGIAIYLQGAKDIDQITLEEFLLPPIEVDQLAPELTLFDLDGNQVSLSDFVGQVVLVNNWATWCPPCRQEMPEFKAYYEMYRDEGFQIIAVEAGQPEAEVRAFVKEQGLEFIILLDPGNKSLITFQNSTLPNSWVIDKKGHLRMAWLGTINLPTLEKYVTPLLKE